MIMLRLLARLVLFLLVLYLLFKIYIVYLRSFNDWRKAALLGKHSEKRIVGFFHPYCNAGGGGERVLWTAIASLHRTKTNVVSVVYSGDIDASKEEILKKVKSRFNIDLDPELVYFVFLTSRYWIEDSSWPRFTLLGQSIGSMLVAWEAMSKLIPHLFLDTMGYAFTFPVVRILADIPVSAYVHYPTISTNMLKRVQERTEWHTNDASISSSAVLSSAKLLYYRLFMYYYSLCLKNADSLMANGSWTKNHVDAILAHQDSTIEFVHRLLPPLYLAQSVLTRTHRLVNLTVRRVYPPCPTTELSELPLAPRERVILSVAQFRPEKDHKAQLSAFAELLKMHPEYRSSAPGSPGREVKLVLIGGSRNEGDASRVEELRALAKKLEIDNQTTFLINAPYSTMLSWLSKASIGLSTMVDEHFGINVVEFMAAGVIPLVHASGGPLQDIVVPFQDGPTGYHATSTSTYAEHMHTILSLPPSEDVQIRKRARECATERFSEEVFCQEWEKGLGPYGWTTWLPWLPTFNS